MHKTAPTTLATSTRTLRSPSGHHLAENSAPFKTGTPVRQIRLDARDLGPTSSTRPMISWPDPSGNWVTGVAAVGAHVVQVRVDARSAGGIAAAAADCGGGATSKTRCTHFCRSSRRRSTDANRVPACSWDLGLLWVGNEPWRPTGAVAGRHAPIRPGRQASADRCDRSTPCSWRSCPRWLQGPVAARCQSACVRPGSVRGR
jgi:hypothetical protein